MHVWRQRVHGNSLYFLLNFAVNLKLKNKGCFTLKKKEDGLDLNSWRDGKADVPRREEK